MKNTYFFSKIIALSLLITGGTINTLGIYLQNESGYSVRCKFGQPGDNISESLDIILDKEGAKARREIFSSEVMDKFNQGLSVRWNTPISPWTGFSAAYLKEETMKALTNPVNKDLKPMRIEWVITSIGYGWNVIPRVIFAVK